MYNFVSLNKNKLQIVALDDDKQAWIQLQNTIAVRVAVKCCLFLTLCGDLFVASIRLLGKCYTRRGIIRQVNIPPRFLLFLRFTLARVILNLNYGDCGRTNWILEEASFTNSPSNFQLLIPIFLNFSFPRDSVPRNVSQNYTRNGICVSPCDG